MRIINYLDVHELLMKEGSIIQFILNSDPLFHEHKEKIILKKGETISQRDSKYIYILESGILAQLIGKNNNRDRIICTSFLTANNIILNNKFSQNKKFDFSAISKVKLIRIETSIALEILEKTPFFTDVLLEIIQDLNKREYTFSSQFQYQIRDRVILLLKKLALEIGMKTENTHILPRGINSYHIAAYCCCTRQSVIKILNDLEVEQLIKYKHCPIEIFDIQKLQDTLLENV
ncbi:Crp/Fnr family transcriptional regulator [Listeria booriae]|uniref:Crp/Fnr family transcriptional regulator n=1 Tax=Listeria booriae TaxID=1552123 RepID=UPI001628480E|nr:Crp/Fnr family transcriptional regulator [Listeria booriae]MBC1558418.1 Crp/Fnr family transcriptional regulator [Listeria booriae]MBC1911887.1 Crp/Fnr family transcriptional regulator [Listeria booriae]MBC2207857.1 Crp/Fnr family transcriptional regulator [Listeria booriae]